MGNQLPPPCPPPGGGVNLWVMRAAHAARRAGVTGEQARAAIESAMTRPPRRGEIERALSRAQGGRVRPALSVAPRRPADDTERHWRERLARIDARQHSVVDLIAASEWLPDPLSAPCTTFLLPALFPGDPLICAGVSRDCTTAPLSELLPRAHTMPQIVPSPMRSVWGVTQDGRRSMRCNDNVGPRHYYIYECDNLTKDTQAGRILHLAHYAPLVLVVDSGGKSLHAWYDVRGWSDERIRALHRYAVRLGADPAMATPCQLTRMPDGTRPETGLKQGIVFCGITPW